MELGSCSYPGLQIRHAAMTFSRGVTPSVCTVAAIPQANLDLPPSLLRFDYGSNTVQFQDAAIMAAFVRRRYMRKGWLHSIQIVDRRWRWAFGGIGGEHNRRRPDGTLDTNTQKSPAQLMTLCLQAMGESGFDVSRVPEGVFPYVNWDGVNPALALAALCDYVACDVVLNYLTNRVEIWPLGTGNSISTGFGEEHPKFAYKSPAKIPSEIQVHCGPSRFQNKLKLRAVATNLSGQQSLIDQSSLMPFGGWSTQALHFPSVTGDNQAAALDQVWRDYRVVGQADGSLNVPGVSGNISSIDQYHLGDNLISYETDLSGKSRSLPYAVGGNYFPYSDIPGNCTNKQWLGRTTLDADRRLVKFSDPVISLTSEGAITEPTMFIVTSYTLTDENGSPIHVSRAGNVGGDGGILLLLRNELFGAQISAYDTGSGVSIVGNNNNLDTVNQEADRYVQIFQQKFNQPFASELTYPGIIPGTLDGNVCQARWECGTNRAPKTMACEVEELDVTAVPRTERRRREILAQLAEGLSQWR